MHTSTQPDYHKKAPRARSGARKIASTDILIPRETQEFDGFCDFCRTAVPESRLLISQGAELCEQCYVQFLFVPDGDMRHCIERFLIGNVV